MVALPIVVVHKVIAVAHMGAVAARTVVVVVRREVAHMGADHTMFAQREAAVVGLDRYTSASTSTGC
jgi:hypothetical protein